MTVVDVGTSESDVGEGVEGIPNKLTMFSGESVFIGVNVTSPEKIKGTRSEYTFIRIHYTFTVIQVKAKISLTGSKCQ